MGVRVIFTYYPANLKIVSIFAPFAHLAVKFNRKERKVRKGKTTCTTPTSENLLEKLLTARGGRECRQVGNLSILAVLTAAEKMLQ